MTENEAREAVTKGAALLDLEMPGWEKKIDLERLNVGSNPDCILGQLDPKHNPYDMRDRLKLSYSQTWGHGFAFDPYLFDPYLPRVDYVTPFWRAAIADRLAKGGGGDAESVAPEKG